MWIKEFIASDKKVPPPLTSQDTISCRGAETAAIRVSSGVFAASL